MIVFLQEQKEFHKLTLELQNDFSVYFLSPVWFTSKNTLSLK